MRALDDQKRGRGSGPRLLDCLLYAGHTGVSTDDGKTVYGCNPDDGNIPLWQVLDRLKNAESFPGVVRDDTAVFSAARKSQLPVISFEVVFPDPNFQVFQRTLDRERKRSQYSYGIPNGNGDCNCTTWLERLGLPLPTGRMDEFIGMPGIVAFPSRLFGECV